MRGRLGALRRLRPARPGRALRQRERSRTLRSSRTASSATRTGSLRCGARRTSSFARSFRCDLRRSCSRRSGEASPARHAGAGGRGACPAPLPAGARCPSRGIRESTTSSGARGSSSCGRGGPMPSSRSSSSGRWTWPGSSRRSRESAGRSCERVASTPAYERSSPRVSVLVPLYNHAEEVTEALASVAASELRELEVVVLDDASTDELPRGPWSTIFAEHPFLPALLLRHRGEPRARDARGTTSPPRLAGSSCSCSTPTTRSTRPRSRGSWRRSTTTRRRSSRTRCSRCTRTGEPETLRSFFPWEPELLRGELHRRDGAPPQGAAARARRVRGGPPPPRLGGLRPLVPRPPTAASGACSCRRSSPATAVPDHSMLAGVTDLDSTEAESILRVRYPVLAALRSED